MICAILRMLLLTTLPSFSPAKNVWLVDAWPRDIAKLKMAAIPASFVYSSEEKINYGLIWVNCRCIYGYFLNSLDFLLYFFTYSYGIRSCDARVLAGLSDSTLNLFKRSLFTKDNNISYKSRATGKNGLCSQLNVAEK